MSASDESWHKVPWHLCQPRFYKAGWSIGNHCKGDYPGKDDAHSVGAEAHRILPELHEVHCQVDSAERPLLYRTSEAAITKRLYTED